MSRPVKVKVVLEFEVDPLHWLEEYAMDQDMNRTQIKADAQSLIEDSVRSLVYARICSLNQGVAQLVLGPGEPERF